MQLVKINASLIHAASAYCSKDQHRPYLQSIRLESCNDGALVIATNGSTMIVLHDPDGSVITPLLLPVSTDIVRAAKPSRKESKILTVESDVVAGSQFTGAAIVRIQDTSFDVVCPNLTFPQWRGVIPNEVSSAEPVNFDPALVKTVSDTFSKLGAESIHIRSNDTSAAVIESHQVDGFALLMPKRGDDINQTWQQPAYL
jgi:hypothetical protein